MEKWFNKGITNWYEKNKRDLPWRNHKDPYKIWLSEIILQQTQVKQGLSYYLKFVKNYPTIKHLANATEDQVLKDWQGLGYYSRARNMHFAAKEWVSTNKTNFPATHSEIKALKGVGDYTAAAIASFAYNLPHAVVDGNVYRLLSRVFGIKKPIDSSDGKKQFQILADNLLDQKNPATYNQAIMEFGSQYCKPSNPDCENCVFKNKCYAFANNKVMALPIKSKKSKVINRYFNYLILIDKSNTILLNRRSAGDIWQGLYDFNLIETESDLEAEKLFNQKKFKEIVGKNFSVLDVSKTYKHVLTHRNLFAKFYLIKLDIKHPKSGTVCKIDTLTKYAFPRLIEKYLIDCKLNELL
jgi:A/G-specific adenine glycosylase